jgi:Cu/Ag efflux protein CusF
MAAKILFGLVFLVVSAFAQTAELTRAIGEVTAIDATAHELTLKPESGAAIKVKLTEKTVCVRVAPGETDLSKAAKIAFEDIGVGDRLRARGRMTEGGATLEALAIIVMTRTDLARKQAADRAEWQRRSVAGVVTAVNAAAREIAISMGPRETARTVTVAAPQSARFRRYAPDSVRFADAQTSSFEAVAVGDQMRVLGDRSEDGSRVQAEEIVFGSFRNIAGQVKAVDAGAGEIRIVDLETKKPVTIRVKTDSTLRRMPEQVAAMMARRRQMTVNGGGAPPAPPQGGPGQGGPGGPRGPRGGMDFQQMIERMPALTLAELKAGDALIILGTKGADASQATAITVVAGVEPLLASASSGPGMGGIANSLNFEIGPQ